MLSRILAAALFLSASCLAQTPTCGLVGYDSGTGDLAYYADSATATYSSFSACNETCTSDTACLSFAYDPTVACILYGTTAESNVVVSSTSPWTFFDRGGVCPVVATTTSTTAAPTATATCTGLVGYDAVSIPSTPLPPRKFFWFFYKVLTYTTRVAPISATMPMRPLLPILVVTPSAMPTRSV